MKAINQNRRIGRYASTLLFSSLLSFSMASAHADLGANLALGAGADGSSKAGGSSYGNVIDGDTSSYWQPSSSSGERIGVKNFDTTFNTVIIRELNDATTGWRLEDHDTGEVLASGASLGSERVISGFGERQMYKVNLIIESASSAPRIGEFELYYDSDDGGDDSSSSSSSSSSEAPAEGETVIYQAEDADDYIGTQETNHSGYTGSGFVDLENVDNSYIEWTVDQAEAGSATATFRFANGTSSNRPMTISVNGTVVESRLDFPGTGGWPEWDTQSVTLNLNQGGNTIRATATVPEGGPNFDRMEVTGGTDSGSSSSSSESSSSSSSSSSTPSGDPGEELSCEQANIVQGFASLGGGTTGGAGGNTITVSTGYELADALSDQKDSSSPLTIYVDGTITADNSDVSKFDIKDMNDVSIIGVGNNALFDGIGIKIWRADNVIVRNITMRYVDIGDKDHITIDGPSNNIWIDHNTFYNSLDVDKDYYDELVSGKNDVDNITVSYNILRDSWKTSLWGSSDGDDSHRRVTFLGNHWENANSRLPLFRFGEAHVLNNYYDGVHSTGINSRMGATIRIEGNVFENAQNPIVSYYSSEIGYWDVEDNIFGSNVTWDEDSSNGIVAGPDVESTVSYTPPYSYPVLPASDTKGHVTTNAGAGIISDCL